MTMKLNESKQVIRLKKQVIYNKQAWDCIPKGTLRYFSIIFWHSPVGFFIQIPTSKISIINFELI